MEWLAQAGLSNALAATLLALLAAVVALARRPALTHGVWLLVLIKLVTPPIAPLAVLPAGTEPPPSAPEGAVAELVDAHSPAELEPLDSSAPDAPLQQPMVAAVPEASFTRADLFRAAYGWRLAAWGAGALGWWGLAGWRIVRFRRMLREARPADPELQEQAGALAERLGLRRCPPVAFVPGRVPPLVWSIGGAPRVVLPEALWTSLEPEARESLLTHELAHLRRGDHWTRWLELLTGGLYWWHPVAWWARRALREAEEQCCDAWVVATRPESARTYARALLATLDFLAEPRPATPLAASGIGHVSCLKRRMMMIVRAETPNALSWRGRLAVLTLGATLLPLAPTWAQREEPAKEQPPAAEAPAREERRLEDAARKRAHQRVEQARRMLERLGVADEQVKKQLDEALAQVEKAFDLGQVNDAEMRAAMDRMRRDVNEARERARVAQRERRGDGEGARPPERAETPERHEQLEKARAEVRELHEQLRKAEDRLAELEGRPRARYRVMEEFVRSRRVDPRGQRQPAPEERPHAESPDRPAGERPAREEPRAREGAPGVPEQRVRQLEERLERLLKEMQDLKSELRKGDPKRSSADPARDVFGIQAGARL